MKVAEAFRDAEALAEFANLNPADSNAVTYFRNNYPDFAPPEWWDYLHRIDGTRVIDLDSAVRRGVIPKLSAGHLKNLDERKVKDLLHMQWHFVQEELQKAWNAQFKFTRAKTGTAALSRKLGGSVNPPEVEDLIDLLKLVFQADNAGRVWNSSQLLLPNGTTHEIKTPVPYSFHKAVLYLHQHPTQAKKCKSCHKYFVTPHGKREFCEYPDERGETCRLKNDRKRKLDYYRDIGKQVRQATTRKRKSSPRLPGSQRKQKSIG